MSIKTVLAAVALGSALLVAPAAVSAKVVHKATKLHTHKLHAKPMARTHMKHTTLHAGKTKAKTLSHSKTKATAAGTTGWKHHRAV